MSTDNTQQVIKFISPMAANVNSVVNAYSPTSSNNDILDSSNTNHDSIDHAAVSSLDPKIDVNSGRLLRFLKRVCEHVDESNMKSMYIASVAAGAVRNLLTEYDELNTVDVYSHAEFCVGNQYKKSRTVPYFCLLIPLLYRGG
jgi:ribosomal protein L30E